MCRKKWQNICQNMPEPCQTAMAIFLLRVIFVVMFFHFQNCPCGVVFFWHSPLRVPGDQQLHHIIVIFMKFPSFQARKDQRHLRHSSVGRHIDGSWWGRPWTYRHFVPLSRHVTQRGSSLCWSWSVFIRCPFHFLNNTCTYTCMCMCHFTSKQARDAILFVAMLRVGAA